MPPFLHPQSDEPALIEAGGGAWTHAELAGTVRERARAMAGRRSLVFVRCGVDARTVIDYLAALTAGHAVALVDGELPGERLSELVERYRPALVLGPDGAAEHKTDVDPHENLSLLLSTSASTGSPRLVRLAGSALEANAVSIALYLELGGDDRAIASLPFHHSYGLSVLNSHLLAGGSVVLPRERVVQAGFWSTFERYACSSFAGVPYTYELLRRAGWDRLPLRTLRTMTQAGGRLSTERILHLHNEMEFRGGGLLALFRQTQAPARGAGGPPPGRQGKPRAGGGGPPR